MNSSDIKIDIQNNCESNVILPGAPWLIAHKSMLSPNKPYKLTLNNQDYVIWKDNRDEVFALNNICPHMQAPLSNGWICSERNTIACPFHGLEFDSQGKLKQKEQSQGTAFVQPLKLIVEGDLVWTYGNEKSRLAIPESIPGMTDEYQFLGIAGEKTIQAPFLDCLKINYDFNHAIATHRQPFKFDSIQTTNYQENGYYTSLEQEIIRKDNTIQELFTNPALLTVSKVIHNHFEYLFPTTTCIIADTFLGKLMQLFVLYPVSEHQTKTFVLLYLKPSNIFTRYLSLLTKSSLIESFNLIIKQDSEMLESLYPKQQPKIRLPREEIMFYAEKLYYQWNKAA